jgi:hypothetical protein
MRTMSAPGKTFACHPPLSGDDGSSEDRDNHDVPLDPARVRTTTATEPPPAPSARATRALTNVLRTLSDTLGVPAVALTRANITSSMELDLRDSRDHLARIEEQLGVAVARAEAVLVLRQLTNAASAKVGSAQESALYDVEDGAWDIVVEDRDDDAHAAHRQAALDELRGDEDEADGGQGAGVDPGVIAVYARYELAGRLGDVVRELQKTDRRDLDEIVSDLRDRLSNDAETLAGARRDIARTGARYRLATALRVTVEAYGRLVKKHLAAWPPSERDAEEADIRAIVFGEEG